MTRTASTSIKETFLRGLVAVVPLTAVVYTLWGLFSTIREAVKAVEGIFQFSPWINAAIVFALSGVIFSIVCLGVGLILLTAVGRALRRWSDNLLERNIPLFGAAKALTARLAGEEGETFVPAEIDLYGSQTRVLGWIVEELPEERAAVYVPMTPAATMGQVYIVARSQVLPIQRTLNELIGPVTDWGAGARRLFEKAPKPQPTKLP